MYETYKSNFFLKNIMVSPEPISYKQTKKVDINLL